MQALESLTGNSWKQLSSACCQVLLLCCCASPHNNHCFHRRDIYQTSPPLKLNTHNPEKHQTPWLSALMRHGRKQRLVWWDQSHSKSMGSTLVMGRKVPRAEHTFQSQGAHKSVCQQKSRAHSSRGKADRQHSTDRNGPHTAQTPRKRSRGEALQLLPHQQPSHEQHQHGDRLAQPSALLVARGGGLAVSSCQSSHSPVGNASWTHPKAAGGNLHKANTGRAPHPPLSHRNSRANSFAAGSRKASQVRGLIFSTNTAPGVQEARAAFSRDRRAALSTGTLASMGITCALMFPHIPAAHLWFLSPGTAQILCWWSGDAQSHALSWWKPAQLLAASWGKRLVDGRYNLDKSIKYFVPSATWKQSADLAFVTVSQELFCLTDSR